MKTRREQRDELIKVLKDKAKKTGEVQQDRKANIAVAPDGKVRPITREE